MKCGVELRVVREFRKIFDVNVAKVGAAARGVALGGRNADALAVQFSVV